MVSVLIAARNEKYLEKTIRNVLENARGEIEILVGLDGYVPDPQIKTGNDRVRFVLWEKSVGQRAVINELARRAKYKFIMKLDAHCAVDEGFDVKLASDCHYTWTMVPRMYNLNINTFTPKLHKKTDYMYITSRTADKPFRMMYYPSSIARNLNRNPEEISDTMCCVGCCWFLHKDRYWELGGLDEGHGGWGQMGIEISLKAWLSGGALKVNKKTWFSHWFRGGVGFPYDIKFKDQQKAREYSQDLWFNNKWPLQKHDIKWLAARFDPPGWNEDLTILFYTANRVSKKILDPVVRSLKRFGFPIISISQEPMNLGTNIVVPKKVSLQNIYRQVLIGAKKAKTEYVALCEDDCLYTREHFDYRPKTFGYNLNRWLLHLDDKIFTYRKRPILSQCIAHRQTLIRNLEDRFNIPEIPDRHCGEMGVFDKVIGIKEPYPFETFESKLPNIVICHKNNTNGYKKLWGKDAEPTKTLEPWGSVKYWTKKFGTNGRLFRQHSHIKSIIFDMDKLIESLIEYRDRRRPVERAQERTKTLVPLIRKIANNEIFLSEETAYREYLLNYQNVGPTKADKLVDDLISLVYSIKKDGVRHPIDIWQDGGNLVIHRGWRRILIMKELGYKKVPARVFESREMFLKHIPDKDAKPDGSIHGLAMKQFMKLREQATDKYWVHGYTKLYDKHIGPLKRKARKILELGVFRGASLLLWKEYFKKARIFGVDKDTLWKEWMGKEDRIKVFTGRQEDAGFMRKKVIPQGKFDIIIDDGGHRPNEQKAAFNLLWDSLAENGIYVIEDLYGNYRPERKGNNTISMLKELIDDMNINCEIKSMCFYYNICFVEKAG